MDLGATDAWVFGSRSEEETERLGSAVAGLITRGFVVALHGELAAGKTCFVRGLARLLTSGTAVHSPTFTLVNEYPRGQLSNMPRLVHVDLYRLHHIEEVYDLPWEELFDSSILCVVEWADRAQGILPENRLDIYFEHAGEHLRRILLVNRGVLFCDWARILEENMKEVCR